MQCKKQNTLEKLQLLLGEESIKIKKKQKESSFYETEISPFYGIGY